MRSGAELTRIAETLNRTMTQGDTTSTLTALSQALAALQSSAPDLLSAVHNASGPLRAAAERREQLRGMLTGGLATGATVAAALENNTATLTGVTARFGPVVDVLGDGSRNFLQISTSLTAQARTFNAMWNAEDQSITAKIIIELTPTGPTPAPTAPATAPSRPPVAAPHRPAKPPSSAPTHSRHRSGPASSAEMWAPSAARRNNGRSPRSSTSRRTPRPTCCSARCSEATT
ncbi:MCE family protein [Nocardia wallacei]|uniref:MCE family protein n=1 Tax=Nocardia wallacei TaxID=480035 RepID=UPI002455ED3E|nr:MCE family protein [Nocardia wallacei]